MNECGYDFPNEVFPSGQWLVVRGMKFLNLNLLDLGKSRLITDHYPLHIHIDSTQPCGKWGIEGVNGLFLKKRLFITFLLALGCVASCASTPQSGARQVYSDYLGACARGDEEGARAQLLHPKDPIDPCPDSPEAIDQLKSSQNAPMTIVAQNSSAQFVQSGDSFKIEPGDALSPAFIRNQLKMLKYAIKNADVEKLSELIAERTRPPSDALAQWIESSRAQAIYAAIAVNPDAWFQIDGSHALCQVSGIVLNFEVEGGQWKWVFE